MSELKLSTAEDVMLFMALASDHNTGATGLTLTVTLKKRSAAFAGISPTVVERGNGWYEVSLINGDVNTLGDLVVRATGSGADPAERLFQVVAKLESDTYTSLDDVPTNAELATALAGADDATLGQIALVKARTDLIPTSPAAIGDAMTLTSGERTSIASAVQMTFPVNFALASIDLSGNVASDVKKIAGSGTAADLQRDSALIVYSGTVTSGTTTTLIDSGLTQTAPNHWINRVVVYLTGELKYQVGRILSFDPSLDQLTFSNTLTGSPTNGDKFIIV